MGVILKYIYEVHSKVQQTLCFSKNYLFIHEYLFVPFKVIFTRYYTLVPKFLSNPRTTQKILFMILFSSSFDAVFICSIVAQRRPFKGLFSFGNKKKSQGADLGNTVAAALLVCYYWPKIRAQATMCEQKRYHGAKANFCSSTNSGVSDELLLAICA